MAKFYPTQSNQILRKFGGAQKTEWQNELLSDFGNNPQATKRMNEAVLQKRGIRQRYLKQPRSQAIRQATGQAESMGFRGQGKAMYVSKNWKKYL